MKLTVCQLGTVGKKLERDASYSILTPTNRSRVDWVNWSQNLGESDSCNDKVSGSTDINFKNTCIIILDSSLLKDPIVIHLLTRSLEFFYSSFISMSVSVPRKKSLRSLRSRAFLPTRARTGTKMRRKYSQMTAFCMTESWILCVTSLILKSEFTQDILAPVCEKGEAYLLYLSCYSA